MRNFMILVSEDLRDANISRSYCDSLSCLNKKKIRNEISVLWLVTSMFRKGLLDLLLLCALTLALGLSCLIILCFVIKIKIIILSMIFMQIVKFYILALLPI